MNERERRERPRGSGDCPIVPLTRLAEESFQGEQMLPTTKRSRHSGRHLQRVTPTRFVLLGMVLGQMAGCQDPFD